MREKNLVLILTFVLVAITFAACTVPINAVVNKPSVYAGKTIVVKGRVINTLHLDDLSFFTIKGGSHKLNVVTNDFLPVVGDVVKVKGEVIPKFYYQRDSILVIREIVKPKDSDNVFNKSVN